ncbi:hypothetical protein R3P38DRAFT_182479 [Favolaschia claudopus]|uniref:Uncharacterized protein n=1 Tax=Favolaschia claudopus TaxID=2862362 RepID=A0AAW0D0X7_9AGAR
MMTFAEKLEIGLEMLREITNIESLQDASRALSLIVSIYLDDPDPPLDPQYRAVTKSLSLLQREPGLHELLKQAHADGSYDVVRNSVLIRHPDAIFPRSAEKFLERLKAPLKAFIASANPVTTWKSELTGTDALTDAHLASLGLLSQDLLPVMSLHDLGSFKHDPILSSRVDELFARGKKTVLVNTSGSGKTRLAFEGLCRHWGLYFTVFNYGARDLGSNDIANVIDRLELDLKSDVSSSTEGSRRLEQNHALAEGLIARALLARLLIFRMFLDIANANQGGLTEEHKKRWLMLQLLPSLKLGCDIFGSLASSLGNFDPGEEIAVTQAKIQELLDHDSHLFFVLDEAQQTARKFSGAFDAEPGKRHPLLLKIIDTWDKYFPAGSMSCVVAGTAIPGHLFEAAKYGDVVRWTSDTGSFDDPAVHERYLRRFLPAAYLDTDSGKAFLHRAWTWTRGRHRHTASLLMQMLVWYFQQPHTVLDDYVEKMTHFHPTDGKKWTDIERAQDWVIPEDVSLLNFHTHAYSSLRHSNIRHILRNVVYHHLVANHPVPPFKKNMIGLVSSGFGRFADGAMENIALDESIALVGATVWMTEQPTRSSTERGMPVDNYLKCIRHYPPSSSKAFAACLAFYFSRAFASNPTLSEIFTFADPVPAWAEQSAELVELHGRPGELRYSVAASDNPTGVLATSASSLDDIVSWLEHTNPDRTPFCVPQAAASPDLVFYLKLQDGSYLSIVMRVSAGFGDDENLLADLEEPNLFCDDEHGADSPTRRRAIELLSAAISSKDVDVSESTTSGSDKASPRVLRVIAAFEEQIDADTLMPTEDGAPYAYAVLARKMFKRFSATVSPETFVRTVARNVLKRKHDSLVVEGDVDLEEAGEERGTKRRRSMPVESGVEDDTEGRPQSKKAAARSGSKRARSAQPEEAASEGRPRGKRARVSESKQFADVEEEARVALEAAREHADVGEGESTKVGGSRGKKALVSGSKKIVDAGETEVDGHGGAAVGKIRAGGAPDEQSRKIKAVKAEAPQPVEEAEISGRMTLGPQTRRGKASSESHGSKEESSSA